MSKFTLESVYSSCPYCGEPIELLIDCSVHEQEYVEDCQVCCRPIMVHARIDHEGDPSVFLSSEDE
ncbi:CPXCG motif-containing cysteine-rich protein [Gammaproteobacteria bacterium]|nr:CPXCG motif-containing cysteine-rich protein [Gammaproteobacteria bacterium]MDA9184853.1 CPXCG motif-containing cysteine-rich protein [Gammaproteobacteria bacterium]